MSYIWKCFLIWFKFKRWETTELIGTVWNINGSHPRWGIYTRLHKFSPTNWKIPKQNNIKHTKNTSLTIFINKWIVFSSTRKDTRKWGVGSSDSINTLVPEGVFYFFFTIFAAMRSSSSCFATRCRCFASVVLLPNCWFLTLNDAHYQSFTPEVPPTWVNFVHICPESYIKLETQRSIVSGLVSIRQPILVRSDSYD